MTPLLLRSAPHVEDIRSVSMDFQVRVGRPRVTPRDGAQPCVLLVTRADDGEMDELSLSLAARGIPVVRLDSDRCVGETLSWDPEFGVIRLDGENFRPAVIWQRYFVAASIAAADSTATLYAREQWAAFVAAVTSTGSALSAPASTVPRTINASCPPGLPDRITQLRVARKAGLRVPASLVTTRPADAVPSIAGMSDLLVKSLGQHLIEDPPGRMRGVFPRRVTRQELCDGTGVEPAPVLVQEFVESERELRVHVVGDRFFGYAITRPTPDAPWTDPDSVVVEPIPVSARLSEQLTSVARAFGLDVAGFDLLDTAEPVFLEVNPEGSWRWVETRCGSVAVSEATRDLIIRTFDESSAE